MPDRGVAVKSACAMGWFLVPGFSGADFESGFAWGTDRVNILTMDVQTLPRLPECECQRIEVNGQLALARARSKRCAVRVQ